MRKLEQLEILNLWDNESVTLDFFDKVTLLTGINGSGKSTILNIIYDALTSHKESRNTSKNRFWSTKSSFESNLTYYSAIFPNVSNNSEAEQHLISLLPKANYHNLSKIKEFEKLCDKDSDLHSKKNITYSDDMDKCRIASVHSVFDSGKDISGNFESINNIIPNCFLYQEDRTSLHKNTDKLEPFSKSYNYFNYKNSIDGRLIYIRNALQNYESQMAVKFAEFIKSPENSKDPLEIINFFNVKTKNKDNVFEILNKYFNETNKEITKDEDNMITAKKIGSDKPIPWYLLSRGEKTLIYLFLTVLIYKDSIYLFDEPEISLHVNWQKNLIKDLISISPNSQFIIATHSPDLIGGDWLPYCLSISED
jgi:predicted ATPase